jgi:hypothetical protein
MSLRSAITALVLFLMLLLLFLGCGACGDRVETREGTIYLLIADRRKAADLGVERCKALDPDEVLESITVSDPDGAEVAPVMVRGRDATVLPVRADPRRCRIGSVKKVTVQDGLDYEITVDGTTTRYTNWPGDYEPLGMGESCRSLYYYNDLVVVDAYAQGGQQEFTAYHTFKERRMTDDLRSICASHEAIPTTCGTGE